jgi:hypothetical protein
MKPAILQQCGILTRHHQLWIWNSLFTKQVRILLRAKRPRLRIACQLNSIILVVIRIKIKDRLVTLAIDTLVLLRNLPADQQIALHHPIVDHISINYSIT